MAIRFLIFMFLLRTSDSKKRLVLHNDQDIDKVLHDMKQDITAVKQENIALKAEIAQLRNGKGATYVRWGRTVCEGNGTQKVYAGYAGGSFYGNAGGAASYICLPENPTWASYKDGVQSIGGLVYGGEYQIVESIFTPFKQRMIQNDVPCVVCHSPRTAVIMIPGSTACNSGWSLEYTGYLMTDHVNHQGGTDYACVDKDPEAVLHGEADLDGKLFYFAEVKCGSLPCQTYPDGRELACAVCSL